MNRRSVPREREAGTTVLIAVTTVVALVAIGVAAYGAWFVLTR